MSYVGYTAQDDGSDSITSGLNLWLELDNPSKMDELLGKLLDQREVINSALRSLHYVHFARFVPSPSADVLQVITTFDGDFDAYVMDFVLAIGEQFEMIMTYVKNRPPSPVKDYPAEFLDFICQNNLSYDRRGGGGIGLYSAYQDRTVIDIVGASGVASTFADAPPVAVDRNDVQANILRGVSSKHSWHAGLRIRSGSGARSFLRALLSEGENAPQVTSDAPWPDDKNRPAYVLNLGFTYSGLVALGIETEDQDAFCREHKAFVRGPADVNAAQANGDIGSSQPALWEFGGADPIDMVVTIHADNKQELDRWSAALLSLANSHQLSLVNEPRHAMALVDPENAARRRVHFGYVDGLSHPGLSSPDAPEYSDMQPKANIGEFLLGIRYQNVYGGSSSLGGISRRLGENGTFAAVRVLEQDVAGFESMLQSESFKHGVDKEWLAAKLMGRWRDGTPVSVSPDSPSKDPVSAPRNDFDYLPSENHRGILDDSDGARCPIGAHIRRMNPRSAVVAGRPHSRRLLRRGMPYGPEFDPQHPDDGQRRGLVGFFICADLDRQFEFIMRQWANGDRATTGIVGQQDPIIGAQESLQGGQEISGEYRILHPHRGEIVLNLPRFVTTVGSVYLFMPGIGGLRYLANRNDEKSWSIVQRTSFPVQLQAWLSAQSEPGVQATSPDPATFDPRDTNFRAEPFATYHWFREHHPVVKVRSMDSTWVFSHRDVQYVAKTLDKFRKRASADNSNAGLLNMDPPSHTNCRREIEELFSHALAASRPAIAPLVSQTYERCRAKGQVRALDWIEQFAKPIAHGAFFDLLGLEQKDCTKLIDGVEKMLQLASPAKDPERQADFSQKSKAAALLLHTQLRGKAKAGRLFHAIQRMSGPHDVKNNVGLVVVSAQDVERLVNTVTLAMAGFLPLKWFIALATWRLLQDNEFLLKQLRSDTSISNKQVIDELLRFDMSAPLSDRYVIHDNTMVGDVMLMADDRVTLSFTSANHDQDEFGPDADKINFKRNRAGPGFAFGYPNEHSCLGQEMVYLVMDPVIQALREADPAPRLEKEFKPAWGAFADSAMFRSMAVLKVHC